MSGPWLPQNPGIGGLQELTSIEQTFLTDFANLSHVTGDIYYYDGSGIQRLPIGSDGKVLKIVTGLPSWQTVSGSGTSLTLETPVGTVDDSNVTFTVSNEPFLLIINGAIYSVGTGTYSSYLAGTITLSDPVGTGGFIISIYQA